MDERIQRALKGSSSLKELAQFEANARERNALTDEIRGAIALRAADFGRDIIKQKTGLELVNLSPAEERITQAIAVYVGLRGGNASRTLLQVKNRGLIGAAEASVTKNAPSQGYQKLKDEGRLDLSYEQIILDNPDEFTPEAIWHSRRTLELPNETPNPPAESASTTQDRTELLLNWLRERRGPDGRISTFDNSEAAGAFGWEDLRRFGRPMGNLVSRLDFACYRAGLPPLGLIAQPSFKAAWAQEGRSWAFPRSEMEAAARSHCWTDGDFDLIQSEAAKLPPKATAAWHPEVSRHEAALRDWAFGLAGARSDAPVQVPAVQSAYWVFVCNPKKWAIDKFLDSRVEHDRWGVRPADAVQFSPGQLGIIRVGEDKRTLAELNGRPRLDAGIYALCEVESTSFPATGASDEFWGDGQGRDVGWPTVKLRYLRNYLGNPLTISKLREAAPELPRQLLDGFQAASFPIPADDFRRVMELLDERLDELPAPSDAKAQTPDALVDVEKKYLHASPEVKERISKSIERGPVGAQVKKANGYKCQVCEALKLEPLGFKKRDGVRYVEAHHVTPVSLRQVGSLAASNIMTVCPNHHRQLHFGEVRVDIAETTFDLIIDGVAISVARPISGTA